MAVFIQPLASVPVTVYVVVLAGVATTEGPVVGVIPVVGLHVYVDAPLAVMVTAVPPGVQ